MKPAPIADYLDHIGSGESSSPRREASPFRPRRPPTLAAVEQRAPASLARAAKPVALVKPEGQEMTRRPVLGPKPLTEPRETNGARHSAPENFGLRLEEARARGREEGVAIGRDDAEERFAGERASLREQAVADRLDFQLNEYAELEATIRTGFAEIETTVGAAVARILKPFLTDEIVKYAVDQLMENIARLSAGRRPASSRSGVRSGS